MRARTTHTVRISPYILVLSACMLPAVLAASRCPAAAQDHTETNMTVDPTTTPYSGDPDAFAETSYLPTDATEGKAQTFNTPYQALFDRTAWLRKRALELQVSLFAAQQVDFANASLAPPQFVQRFKPWPLSPPVATFTRGGWLQTDTIDGGGLWWHIPIRSDVKITMIAASIRGSDGPGVNPGFPSASDRPFMRFYKQPVAGGEATPLLTVADETGSKAEYEDHHTIPLDPSVPFVTPFEFLAGETLVIEFVGHKGANVGDNTLKLYSVDITPDMP